MNSAVDPLQQWPKWENPASDPSVVEIVLAAISPTVKLAPTLRPRAEMVLHCPNRAGVQMDRIRLPLIISMMIFAAAAPAEEHTGRIKRKPPGATEAGRIASDMAMNDSLLQKGDIVATDRGFFILRGLAPDGISNDFVPVPNPLSSNRK